MTRTIDAGAHGLLIALNQWRKSAYDLRPRSVTTFLGGREWFTQD